MRLWHQSLIRLLPKQQLLGQHRECCALRGAGWYKKHSTVDYVLKGSFEQLIAYHTLIMTECAIRKVNITDEWKDPKYRGTNCDPHDKIDLEAINKYILSAFKGLKIYEAHNIECLEDCLNNLENKGVIEDVLKFLGAANGV